MRKLYLRIAQPFLCSEMVLSETLNPHCAKIVVAAKSRMNTIRPQLMKYYGVTEQLKAADQFEWVRQMNACEQQGRGSHEGRADLHRLNALQHDSSKHGQEPKKIPEKCPS